MKANGTGIKKSLTRMEKKQVAVRTLCVVMVGALLLSLVAMIFV